MNNILLDNHKVFTVDYIDIIELNEEEKNLELIVKEGINVELTIIGIKANLTLKINLEKNSKLFLQLLTIDGSVNINTELNQYSEFKLNNSILTNQNCTNTIKITHLEDKSISNIKNHGFSTNGSKLVFNVEGIIPKQANKCIHHQDNQIIENENSFSTILPKLYIDNYDVDATHAAYVGEFKEESLFFLMSRGISKEDSKFLLLNAFLLGYLDLNEEYESKLNHLILKYFNKEV